MYCISFTDTKMGKIIEDFLTESNSEFNSSLLHPGLIMVSCVVPTLENHQNDSQQSRLFNSRQEPCLLTWSCRHGMELVCRESCTAWQREKLPQRQLDMPPVATKFAWWQLSVFSVPISATYFSLSRSFRSGSSAASVTSTDSVRSCAIWSPSGWSRMPSSVRLNQ